MAKMVKCRSCGGQVSNTARTCPHCGGATWTDIWIHIIQLVAIIVAGAYLYYVIFG